MYIWIGTNTFAQIYIHKLNDSKQNVQFIFFCAYYSSSQTPQVNWQFLATQLRSHLSWFNFFWHLAADQTSWHCSSPDPPSHNSQVNWQCLATQFLLHLPLFFLFWHFLVDQISSQTSPDPTSVVVVVEAEVVVVVGGLIKYRVIKISKGVPETLHQRPFKPQGF